MVTQSNTDAQRHFAVSRRGLEFHGTQPQAAVGMHSFSKYTASSGRVVTLDSNRTFHNP